jgi:polysaccharide export outer membrane protein
MNKSRVGHFTAASLLALAVQQVVAQTTPAQTPAGQGSGTAPPAAVPQGVPTPEGYVIGPEDVLTVLFWRDKDLSGDVMVRPDGFINVPLLNDVMAAGLTPEQLRLKLMAAAAKFLAEPNATVVVKQINSRKVYITGMVNKVGPVLLTGPMNVLQLITMAGGLQPFADEENIIILRNENGRQSTFRFNYKEVSRRKNLAQNIPLVPGDTVVVP